MASLRTAARHGPPRTASSAGVSSAVAARASSSELSRSGATRPSINSAKLEKPIARKSSSTLADRGPGQSSRWAKTRAPA